MRNGASPCKGDRQRHHRVTLRFAARDRVHHDAEHDINRRSPTSRPRRTTRRKCRSRPTRSQAITTNQPIDQDRHRAADAQSCGEHSMLAAPSEGTQTAHRISAPVGGGPTQPEENGEREGEGHATRPGPALNGPNARARGVVHKTRCPGSNASLGQTPIGEPEPCEGRASSWPHRCWIWSLRCGGRAARGYGSVLPGFPLMDSW